MAASRGPQPQTHACTPARVARAARRCMAIEASSPMLEERRRRPPRRRARSTPTGCRGSRSAAVIQRSLQSSSDRNEPRGAAGFARIASQARVADGHERHPWRPGRGTSAGRRRRGRCPSRPRRAPRRRTTRRRPRSSRAPWARAIGPISRDGVEHARRRLGVDDGDERGLRVVGQGPPHGGRVDRPRRRAPRSRRSSAPTRPASTPNPLPKTPETRFRRVIPGRTSARAAASRPSTASPCIRTIVARWCGRSGRPCRSAPRTAPGRPGRSRRRSARPGRPARSARRRSARPSG